MKLFSLGIAPVSRSALTFILTFGATLLSYGQIMTPGWTFTYEWSGQDKITTVQVVAGVKTTYSYTNSWTDHGGAVASNPSPSDNNIYETSVSSSGTCTIVAHWTGTVADLPANLFVHLDSRAESEAVGSGAAGSADDGLRHAEILNPDNSPIYRASLSSGSREICFQHPGIDVRIPVQMNATAYSKDSQNDAVTALSMQARGGTKAIAISSTLDPTYRRDVGVDAVTGYKVGIARQNQADATGTMYGDMEVGLYYDADHEFFDNGWTYQTGLTYNRSLVGPWNSVFNEWWITNPQDYRSDSALSEMEWVNLVFGRYSYETGQPEHFISSTTVQTIHYQATDDVDGFQADNWFIMTLHGPAHKEEEYKDAYDGYLYKTASGVGDLFPAVHLIPSQVNLTNDTINFKFTHFTAETLEYGAKLTSSVTLTIAKVVQAQFGADIEVSTRNEFSDTTEVTLPIPSQKRLALWACPKGTVHYWNESLWGDHGYGGDAHVNDVRPGAIDCVWITSDISEDDVPPFGT